MKVLVIDIGGNSVKFLITGETEPRKFPSGPELTPRQLASGVRKLSEDWKYDAVSIGYPGRVRDNQVGGGSVTKLDKLPPGCRAGDNTFAFQGGFLLWEQDGRRKSGARVTASSSSSRKH